MIDRKKLVEGLEYCIEAKGKNCPMACPFFKECFSVFESSTPFYPIMRATLELLKEEPDIVWCRECIRRGTYNCPIYVGGDADHGSPDNWYCADGEVRQDE